MNFMDIWTSPADDKRIPISSEQSNRPDSQCTTPSTSTDSVHYQASKLSSATEFSGQREQLTDSHTNRRQNHELLSQENYLSAKIRPCLAGTQTMQHLIRSAPKFDHFSTSPVIPNSDIEYSNTSGHFSSNQLNLSADSSGFSSSGDNNSSLIHFPSHLQTNLLSADDRELVSQLLDRYTQARLWENTKQVLEQNRNTERGTVFRDSPKRNFQTTPIRKDSEILKTPSQVTKMTETSTPRQCDTSSEFVYSTPVTSNSHTGKDLQMLEENMASVAKYVEELTGGGSNKTSRASSCVRPSEAASSFPVNTTNSTNSEPPKVVYQTGGSQSPSTDPHNASNKNVEEAIRRISQTSFRSEKRESPPQPQRPNMTTQLTLLNSLLNKNSYSNSGNQDTTSSQANELFLSLLANLDSQLQTHARAQTTHTPIPETHTNEWNLLQSALKAQNFNQNNFLTNQMLNLQAALTTLSPSALNILVSTINTTQPTPTNAPGTNHTESNNSNMNSSSNNNLHDIKQTLFKNLANQKTNQGGNSSRLLSAIVNMLSGGSEDNLAVLLSNTSSLTALAATLDSVQGQQLGNNFIHRSQPIISEMSQECNQGNNAINHPSNTFLMRNQNTRQSSYNSYQRRQAEEVPKLVGPFCQYISNVECDIDRAATIYRNSANNVAQKLDVILHWSGSLPMRNYKSMNFSRKVFLGGVPWDSTSEDLIYTFSQFGNVSVLWPQRDGYSPSSNHDSHDRSSTPKGYCYLLFEHEQCVCELLSRCSRDLVTNGDYFKLSSPKFKSKDVQVIPWMISDSQFSRGNQTRLESSNTVFVGALHGMITAEALAAIMNDLFENVVFAALDTDKHKYPIGSGRVVFSSNRSYMKAVTANFVEVCTPKFKKTLQIDPFLEDSTCNNCLASPGVYFCRAFECFQYFCPTCWHQWHSMTEALANHKPLRRSLKPSGDRA